MERDYGMKLLITGKDAHESLVDETDIDWGHIRFLNLWVVEEVKASDIPIPGGASIEWVSYAGFAYCVAAIFLDETWVWTARLTDVQAAKEAIQSLSARRDKPIRRMGNDIRLKVEGY